MTPEQKAARNDDQRRLDDYKRRVPGKGNWTFDDDHVDWAIGVVKGLDLGRIQHWLEQERRGPGGIESRTPLLALLVAMVLGACELLPYQGRAYTNVLYRHLSPRKRARLGVGEPPDPADTNGWDNVERSVLRRMHALFDVIDPSPFPKNRRRTPEQFEAATKDLSEEQIAIRYDRLCWFINRIIEASLEQLPREFRRRWNGHVGLDSTPIRAYSDYDHCTFKPKKGGGWAVDEIITHASDPDAGPYARDTDHRDISNEPDKRRRAKKKMFAHEATLVIMGPDGPDDDDDGTFPYLFVAMAPLHRPGADPGGNAIVALASIRERGYRAGNAPCDRAYTSAHHDRFALPARALGYEPVLDYRDDQLGRNGRPHGGFIEVEGAHYCPSMPSRLIMATMDHRNKRITDDEYQELLEARAAFRVRLNGRPDHEGHQRLLCPAAGAAPTARCELKPASTRGAKGRKTAGKTRIPVTAELRDHPPACCRQQTVTLPPEAMSRYLQRYQYGTPAWHQRYSLLRNAIEGGNGHLKEGSGPAIGDAGRRRIRGIAAQSVFVALAIFGLNLQRIGSFLKKCIVGDDGVLRTRTKEQARRRRTTKPLADYTPTRHTGDPPLEA